MEVQEKFHQKNSLVPPPWKPPLPYRRILSALIDLVVWMMVLIGTMGVLLGLARIALGIRPPFEVELCLYGIGALCANLYLAISNGTGRSVGKALTGLRLVVFVGQYPVRPGFARGLVRSSLQAGPCMGALMFCAGLHDTIAGTKIVQVVDATAWDRWEARSISSLNSDAVFPNVACPPRIAIWKIAMAVLFHLFSAMVYMVSGTL